MSGMEMTGPVTAFVAGVITSLHCVGMCGPIACAMCLRPCLRQTLASSALYHGMRVLGYGGVGYVAGWVGEGVSRFLLGGSMRGVCWVFVLLFLAVVLGFDKKLQMRGLGDWFLRLVGGRMEGKWAGGMVGLFTPFLPCVPLYLAFGAAGLAGSGAAGAGMMVAFGLGTVPLLLVAQGGMGFLERRWRPEVVDWVRRGFALLSVGVLVVRALYEQRTGCPMCH